MGKKETKFVYCDFGLRLREWLEVRGMTQTELSDKINVKKQQLTRWISGQYIPSEEKAEEIADALEIPRNLKFDFLEKRRESIRNSPKSTARKTGDEIMLVNKQKTEELKNNLLNSFLILDEFIKDNIKYK